MALIEACARFERQPTVDRGAQVLAHAALAELIRATADDLNTVAALVAQRRHAPAELARRLDAIATAAAVLASDVADL